MQKHYDYKTIEKNIQKLWSDEKTYFYSKDLSKPLYSIDTPPPTVNGSLHIGHIFSYAQAEMIARFKRMQGYNIFYPFGFDDNGLPTERLVEKVLGVRASEMRRSTFSEHCLSTTENYEKEFKDLWQSLGFSCDWNLQYETISPLAQRISQRSFIELYKMGKAYIKESPVLWCTNCQTSIAQAELETIEKETRFYNIKFGLKGSESKEQLLIATTRPELLNGCVSLFVHPEDERYQRIIGKEAIVPLYDYAIPILAESTVAMDKGTGIVMCATYGDSTDVDWVQSHDLPYRRVIEQNGLISDDDPIIGGMHISKARKHIVQVLDEAGYISEEKEIEHFVAVHERCGTHVEIMPSKQWYVDILTDKERFIEAADEINWYPEHMKNRYLSWVHNLKWDWCISRQRYFGVPIPVWYCEQCGAIQVADDEDLSVNPLESAPKKSCSCGSNDFLPESAVLDTWATSSVTPLINSHWGEKDGSDITSDLMPMTMRTQAHEIIRTWAFYTIVKSIYHTGQIPWKDLMVCGFVLAKKGEKISKSKNNASQSPPALIEAHSADAIRYWAANAKLGTDTFFDADELTISKRLINKLWNASKFCFIQLDDYESEGIEAFLPVDLWILERLQDTFNKAASALNEYEIGTARHHIDAFFWNDFCDNYLELVKERVYQPEKHGHAEKKSGQAALYRVLLGVLELYAPYIPHITEYLYQTYFVNFESEPSLHIRTWPSNRPVDEVLYQFGEEIKVSIAEARRYKSEHSLSMKSPMPLLELRCTEETEALYDLSLNDLKACTHAEVMAKVIS